MNQTTKNESFDGVSATSAAEELRVTRERAAAIIQEVSSMNFELAAETVASMLSKLTAKAKDVTHPDHEKRMDRLYGLIERASDKATSK